MPSFSSCLRKRAIIPTTWIQTVICSLYLLVSRAVSLKWKTNGDLESFTPVLSLKQPGTVYLTSCFQSHLHKPLKGKTPGFTISRNLICEKITKSSLRDGTLTAEINRGIPIGSSRARLSFIGDTRSSVSRLHTAVNGIWEHPMEVQKC